MDDLISRQAAINEIEFGIIYAKAIDKETGEVKELFQERNDELRWAAERIKQLPSVQSEIIRCKDCKYNVNPPEAGNADCDLFYGMTDQYGFCHCAERRTDESKYRH